LEAEFSPRSRSFRTTAAHRPARWSRCCRHAPSVLAQPRAPPPEAARGWAARRARPLPLRSARRSLPTPGLLSARTLGLTCSLHPPGREHKELMRTGVKGDSPAALSSMAASAARRASRWSFAGVAAPWLGGRDGAGVRCAHMRSEPCNACAGAAVLGRHPIAPQAVDFQVLKPVPRYCTHLNTTLTLLTRWCKTWNPGMAAFQPPLQYHRALPNSLHTCAMPTDTIAGTYSPGMHKAHSLGTVQDRLRVGSARIELHMTCLAD